MLAHRVANNLRMAKSSQENKAETINDKEDSNIPNIEIIKELPLRIINI